MIFSKQVTAEKIRKAIDKEDGALQKVQGALGEVATALDTAIRSGKDTEALYEKIATLELQAKTRQGIIARMQIELAAAVEAERRAARDRELAAYQAVAKARLDAIESDAAALDAKISAVFADTSALNGHIGAVALGAPDGAGPSQMLRFNAEEVLKGRGTLDFLSNLRSLRVQVLGAISSAQKANRPVDEEPVVASAPRGADIVNARAVNAAGRPLAEV